ncbi:RNA-guided endonuclease IscB [Actinoplanes derwentensis]|uniref:RNA-guided endonuclease IscB n=1 Tax=Actinoplanes derwentensis TaxID=113562 RepID=UPI002F91BF07
MLPQPGPLESRSADNPSGRDETGSRRPIVVVGQTGVQHGRGETAVPVPAQRRHPGTVETVSGAGGNAQQQRLKESRVFVLDQAGKALQPCAPARARQLLRAGRAAVHRRTPFVIRLRDRGRDESVVPGVEAGVDPGSRYTGISVFTSRSDETGPEPVVVRTGAYSIGVQHRGGQIRDRLTARAALRRGRRTRNLRYRAPRFDNRRRPAGWLPPSLRHRIETTMSWINRLRRWAPVTAVHVEHVAFDTQLLADPQVQGRGYQHGEHAGRVAVRSSGRFNIRTAMGLVQGIHHRHVRLLQRGDGWSYRYQQERFESPPA